MSVRRTIAGAALALALTTVAACAKRGPPSGGPPDLERPRVVQASPDSGAAAVPRDVHPSITFSEAMEPQSTGDAVDLAPRVPIRQRRWSGRTLTIVFGETLATNRTYTLFVSGTARDRHGNPIGVGRTVAFTTAAAFPTGRLGGTIEARGFQVGGTYLWCYDARRTGVPDSTARDFDAIGVADDKGAFSIPGLQVPGRYRLWAFADLNANRSFEPDKDVLAAADTVLELTPERPTFDGLSLRVTNPRASATIAGAVLDTLGDSLGILRVVAHSESDTMRRILTDVGRDNGFQLQLEPGPWTIQAWRDLDRNRQWNIDNEPASEVKLIHPGPADEVKGVVLVLVRPPGVRSGP